MAGRITHRVGVFGVEYRPVIVRRGSQGAHRFLVGIHAAAHVNVVLIAVHLTVFRDLVGSVRSPFVMQEPATVTILDPGGHRSVVRPRTSLVTQRPGYDAGVVLVPLDHADGAVQHRGREHRHTADHAADLVGFDVGFVHDVEPDAVGEFVEVGIVGVVAGPDGIDVKRLHQPQVFPDLRPGDRLTVDGAVVVPVDAVENYVVTIDRDAVRAPGHVAEADV